MEKYLASAARRVGLSFAEELEGSSKSIIIFGVIYEGSARRYAQCYTAVQRQELDHETPQFNIL